MKDHQWVSDFLNEYWQKKPWLKRNFTTNFNDVLEPDDLAGLAADEEAEARIIEGFWDTERPIAVQQSSWSQRFGPFDTGDYQSAGKNNWTLLVQSVDHWSSEVAAVLGLFDFLPAWRLDDVMISYAPTGGGVGPHFDYYDVFLLQTHGTRRWLIGQECDEKSSLRENEPIKLLEEFKRQDDIEVSPGDLLYIPAGKAHWGIALDDECMTWSIGFRAPSYADILDRMAQHWMNRYSEHHRYKDSRDSLQENRFELGTSAQAMVLQQFSDTKDTDLQALMSRAMAELCTEPRNDIALRRFDTGLDVDEWINELSTAIAEGGEIERVPGSRTLFVRCEEVSDEAVLYANGHSVRLPSFMASKVCGNEITMTDFIREEQLEILALLCYFGVYQLSFS